MDEGGDEMPGAQPDDLDAYLREERGQFLTRIADLESLLSEAKDELERLRRANERSERRVRRLRDENEQATRLFRRAKAEVQRLLDNGTTVQISLHGVEAELVAKAVVQAKADAALRSDDSPCPPGFVCAEHGQVGR